MLHVLSVFTISLRQERAVLRSFTPFFWKFGVACKNFTFFTRNEIEFREMKWKIRTKRNFEKIYREIWLTIATNACACRELCGASGLSYFSNIFFRNIFAKWNEKKWNETKFPKLFEGVKFITPVCIENIWGWTRKTAPSRLNEKKHGYYVYLPSIFVWFEF